jgi:hypothetical protein
MKVAILDDFVRLADRTAMTVKVFMVEVSVFECHCRLATVSSAGWPNGLGSPPNSLLPSSQRWMSGCVALSWSDDARASQLHFNASRNAR